jgi:hypothetical protein
MHFTGTGTRNRSSKESGAALILPVGVDDVDR